MLIIGKSQKLQIEREVDFGLYLTNGEDEVLLPNKYVPIGSKIGDEIEVFVYKDSGDRPVATTLKPYGEVDDIVGLEVKSISKFGAFMDIGLEKDLLIPFKEQHKELNEGQATLVKIILDQRTNRMIGVTKLLPFLKKHSSELNEGEEVDILIWEKSDMGYKVIINQSFQGLIYSNEIFDEIDIGMKRKGYIKKVRDDGKVDVSLQKGGYREVMSMSDKVMEKILENGGVLGLGDKSSPEEIKLLLGMSKKNFKKIIGGLYKAGEITIGSNEVKIKKVEG